MTPTSPRLAALRSALASGQHAALATFWRDLAVAGTPLIEPLSGDDAQVLVTFLWRANAAIDNVVLISDLVSNLHWCDSFANSALLRLGTTDLYYRTYQLRADARFTYHLAVNQPLPDPSNPAAYRANWQADPLNRSPFRFPRDERDPTSTSSVTSVVELPAAPAQPWIRPRSGQPGGAVQFHTLHSSVLDNEQRVWVYTPPHYHPSGTPYPVLLLFDGWTYMHVLPTITVLDNLIAARQIPPIVAVMLESPNRNRVLALYPPFLEMLAQEVDPWMHAQYHVARDPRHRIVGGLSLGGLTALYVGLRHPGLFGKVLSQSGGVFWAPADDPEPLWLARQFAASPRLPLQLYLDVGMLEREATWNAGPSQLNAHRHLRDVLRAKGYPLQYQEYNGDHHFVCWRGTLADGLTALLSDDGER